VKVKYQTHDYLWLLGYSLPHDDCLYFWDKENVAWRITCSFCLLFSALKWRRFLYLRTYKYIFIHRSITHTSWIKCDGHTVHKLSQWCLTADLVAPRESDCSQMCGKFSSDWLPSYIKATWPVLEIFKMAGYFLDKPHINFSSQISCLLLLIVICYSTFSSRSTFWGCRFTFIHPIISSTAAVTQMNHSLCVISVHALYFGITVSLSHQVSWSLLSAENICWPLRMPVNLGTVVRLVFRECHV